MKTSTEAAREILTTAYRSVSNEDAVADIERIISARDAEHEDRCRVKVERAVERAISTEPADGRIPFVTRTGERLEPSAEPSR